MLLHLAKRRYQLVASMALGCHLGVLKFFHVTGPIGSTKSNKHAFNNEYGMSHNEKSYD